jgi:hypothetical protein
VVREWPETLVPLRRVGVDLAAAGGRTLGDLDDAGALQRLIVEVTAWRN